MLFEDAPKPHLVGIAKLASESEPLAGKSTVQYYQIQSRSILNRTKPGMPFQWTINPYRGCEFGCKYCYARYTHEFMNMEESREFEEKIYAKAAAPEILKRELRKLDRREAIAIGTATDPYQPAERKFLRTLSILKVLGEEKGRRLSVTTKSDLITRDVEVLKRIAKANVLDVNITITTLDEALARLMEPRAPRPDLRLEAVRKLTAAGICTGVFSSPILPMITDREEMLEPLAKAACAAGAKYFGGGPLFLMPCAQKVFFPFLQERFPELWPHYRRLYQQGAYVDRHYKEKLRERVRKVRERYGIASAPLDYKPELWEGEEQLTLF